MAAALLRPEALWILVLAPIVWGLLWSADRVRARRLRTLVGPRVEQLAAERSDPRRRLRRAAFALGVLLTLVAALGPVLSEAEGAPTWRGVDLVVALDVSRSMLAGDVTPSRLARAKADLAELAAHAAGDRFGLVVFAGEARRLVPLTPDRVSFTVLAERASPLSVDRGGTDLAAALDAAAEVLRGGAREGGVIVLVTDGEDHAGRGLAAARRLASEGLVIHTVGIGTPRGGKIALEGRADGTWLRDRRGQDVVSSLDTESLRALSDATGGSFVRGAEGDGTLVALYDEEILPLAQETQAAEDAAERRSDYQGILLLAFLAFLLGLATMNRRAS